MKLSTFQLAKHKAVRRKVSTCIDITVGSGNRAFSPTWDILMDYKNKKHDNPEDTYTQRFTEHMRYSYLTNKVEWMTLIKHDEVAIGCYCRPGEFCHRLLLVDILEKVCKANSIAFEYIGEIT